MSRPFVRVLGVALAVSACEKPAAPQPITGNPPVPEVPEPPPVDPTTMTHNPPMPLPTWDDVKSTHPEGATNPPSPVLVVTREDNGCHKAWMGGMIPWPKAVSEANGKVVATLADVGTATRIQCPPGEPQRLLTAWDALPAEVRDAADGPRPPKSAN